ncbi:MAG: pentapeptide repeat-containing protein, partial [Cyanobacteria bacterium J06649_11]
NLTDAKLGGVNLYSSDLFGAQLNRVQLKGANLSETA